MLSTVTSGAEGCFDWIVTTGPAAEPVTAAQVKSQLRLTTTDDDTRLSDLIIPAARSICEAYTNRAFIDQSITLIYDGTPPSVLELPRAPLDSVTSINTIDSDGTSSTFATTNYTVDTGVEPGRVFLKESKTWPSDLRTHRGVEIVYVAGYGTAGSDVPSPINHAIILQAAYMFENPLGTDGKEQNFVSSVGDMEPIHDAKLLLNRYKVWNV